MDFYWQAGQYTTILVDRAKAIKLSKIGEQVRPNPFNPEIIDDEGPVGTNSGSDIQQMSGDNRL